ncbi:07a43aa3-81a5-4768-9422-655b5aa20577 [Sclerotinia trifoliorum]|uniref:Neutral protease 2 n=1 Tax=Sclerotinia trifoliorum TaxID=28548 RepID=A0A8H2VY98_9HELO|nr:07a43aa3-81a5-4768-9422-655b5aa20577 [Sclerotinia trifoliorum]
MSLKFAEKAGESELRRGDCVKRQHLKMMDAYSYQLLVPSISDHHHEDNNVLEVTSAAGDNALVHATVKNTGIEALNLLKYGTLFDSAPVQKVDVYEGGELKKCCSIQRDPPFHSAHRLSPRGLHTLAAGETFETTVNAAEVHDLSSTNYTFIAEGSIPVAPVGSTKISDTILFKSNTLTIPVDGAAAQSMAKAIPASIDRCTILQSGCSTTQKSQTTQALSYCAQLARAASTAASSGSATKFSEYFKTTAAATRSVVAARLSAVASQCSSLTSGSTTYYCTDIYNYCSSNVLAYTIPSTNEIVNCPLYYSALPTLSGTCHAQDRATTSLHEFTHAPATYSPGTADNGYGYSAAVALTSAKAVLNADSYALYANAIYVGC